MMFLEGFFCGQGQPERCWVIDTAASQTIICYPADPPPPPPPPAHPPPPPLPPPPPPPPPPSTPPPPPPSPPPPPPESRVLAFIAPLCCDGCVQRVYKHLREVEGVERVHCDYESQIVTVKGYTPPDLVLKELRKQLKRGADLLPPPPPQGQDVAVQAG